MVQLLNLVPRSLPGPGRRCGTTEAGRHGTWDLRLGHRCAERHGGRLSLRVGWGWGRVKVGYVRLREVEDVEVEVGCDDFCQQQSWATSSNRGYSQAKISSTLTEISPGGRYWIHYGCFHSRSSCQLMRQTFHLSVTEAISRTLSWRASACNRAVFEAMKTCTNSSNA